MPTSVSNRCIDEQDEGDKDGNVRGNTAAGKKTYATPRRCVLRKNGRGEAPQSVVGMAATRDKSTVRN